jgi:hypothetical protein
MEKQPWIKPELVKIDLKATDHGSPTKGYNTSETSVITPFGPSGTPG